MLKHIFLILIFLCSLSSFAQTTAQDYEFLAKSQTVIITNTEFIRLDFQKRLVNVLTDRPELLTNEDPTELIQVIEEMSSQGLPNRAKVKLDETVKKLVTNSVKEIRTIIRRHGMTVGIAYAAISLASYGASFVLIAAGQVQAAAIMGAVPFGTIFLVTTVAVKRIIKYQDTIKLYGGKENYKYYSRLNKEVKQKLKLKGKDGLIVPLERFGEDEYVAVSLSQLNILHKILDFVDHDRSKLTLKQLKYFLQRNNGWDKEMQNISGTQFSEELKIASMLMNLKNKNADLFAKVQTQFPDAFALIPEHEFSQALKEWTLAGFHAQNREELLKSADLIPLHSRVIDILKIWTKCIVFFHIEEGKNLTYKGYRNLSKSVDRLEIEADLHMHNYVDEKWKKDFQEYLRRALNLSTDSTSEKASALPSNLF